jgi:predicted dehydrogenase
MFCHWRYVLDHTIAPVTGVCCIGRNHIPQRRDDEGESYIADADDGAFAMLELEGNVIAQVASSWATRVRRDDLVTVQVDGTAGSAVAGLQRCWVQSGAETPRPIWNPDEPQSMTFPDQWREVYASESFDNGFKAQWLLFLRHLYDGAPYIYDLMEGVKGVQLADAALKSWRTRRWVEIGAAVEIA